MKMMTNYEEYLNMELNLTFEGMRSIHSQAISDIDKDADAGEMYEELIKDVAKYAVMCAKCLNFDRKEESERNSGRTF